MELIDINIFGDIPGWEKYYQIDHCGVIKSVAKTMNNFVGGRSKLRERILKTHKRGDYLNVVLTRDRKRVTFRVHRLIALTFLPNPNNYPIVRHLNDNKLDNRLSNLAWGTHSENTIDAIKNGKMVFKYGKDHHWHGKSFVPHNKGVQSYRKILIDLQTGVFYFGVREAANAKCININNLRGMLSGFIKNRTSLIYI